MNIYDFITDKFQYDLKEQASKKNTRFENTLSDYKELFFLYLKKCRNNDTSQYLSKTLKGNCSVTEWLNCFNSAIQSEYPAIESLFDEIIYGYSLFLKNKHYLAVLKYQDILDKYQLLEEYHRRELSLFYRGFWKSKDRKTSDKNEYFHIPFNKRSLVKNQRFSFSGIPLLYLGASLIDTMYELRCTNLNSDKIAFASFAINPLISRTQNGKDRTKRIFNISNEIFDLVNQVFGDLVNSNVNFSNCNNEMFVELRKEYMVLHFKKFIISQLCTFPTKDRTDFIEEYVIPQLFTEALYQCQFDGIVFPSTRFYGKNIIINADTFNNKYQNNLVLFTKFDANNNYDELLRDNFEITIKNFRGCNANTKDILCYLGTLSQKNTIESYLKDKCDCTKKITDNLLGIGKQLQLYDAMIVDGTPYFNTKLGKLELRFIKTYYEYIMNCLKYL